MKQKDSVERNGKIGPLNEKGDHSEREPVIRDAEILIRRALGENFDQGVELLFRCYYVPLCNHAVRYVSSKEIAEDIVSEVFSSCYTNKAFADVKSSYRAYLFTAVRNRAFNYVRFELNRSVSLENAEPVPIGAGQQPDELTHYEEMYHDVETAIEHLPPKRRSIYIMHRIEGKKQEEIARELNISLKTVKEHMYQALLQIRKQLRERWALVWLACQVALFI